MEEFSTFSLNKNQHRKIIGYLGLSIPFIMYFGNLFYGCKNLQNSISHYYHTFMRDVLVGIIIVIALFFITYKGYKKDRIPFIIAGISALFVAFFPTALDPKVTDCCKEFITTNRNFSYTEGVHNIAAISFFITLTYICLFLFTKSKYDKPKYKEHYWRNVIIKICGILMLLAIILIAIIFINKIEIEDINLLFYLESIALFAFSIAWLVKGRFINKLNDKTLL